MTGPASDPRVAVRREAALVRIRMDDGTPHNQLDAAACAALAAAFSTCADDPEARVVLLESGGRSFCLGASPELMNADPHDRARSWGAVLHAVLDCPLPTVAAVHGPALGGGLLLALSCDIRVLSEDSRYGANFLLHGFTPIGGSLVPAVLGHALGAEMLLTGRTYPGRELARRGAGVSIVAHSRVAEEAGRAAARIAQAPRPALEWMKRQLSAGLRAEAAALSAAEIDAHARSSAAPESRRRVAMVRRAVEEEQ